MPPHEAVASLMALDYPTAMNEHGCLSFRVELPGGQARLREMILHICMRCGEAERFGKVKLNKILWRADFKSFAERRLPVTGRTYQKLAAGPAPLEMPLVLAELEAEGLLTFSRRELADGYVELRPVAQAPASLKAFSQDDLDYVDEAIEFYRSMSATQASDLSHGVIWKSRKFLDPIPYEAAFLSDAKPTSDDRQRFGALAAAKGWTSL